MAKMEGEWSHQHRKIIDRIETELGREICGVPTSSGLPCKEWPISQTHGRCRRHSPSDPSSPPDQTSEPQPASHTRPEPARAPSQDPQPSAQDGTSWTTLTVVVVGILGGALIGGGVFFRYPEVVARFAGPEEKNEVSRPDQPTQPEPRPVSQPLPEVDPQNPKFREIVKYYRRSGQAGPVLATLNRIVEQSSKPRHRAEALYRKYVLLQMEERFKESLEVADRLLAEFPKNAHRPEVLYGAGWIASNFLNDTQRARSYFQRLKDEFPKSKWAQSLSSSRS